MTPNRRRRTAPRPCRSSTPTQHAKLPISPAQSMPCCSRRGRRHQHLCHPRRLHPRRRLTHHRRPSPRRRPHRLHRRPRHRHCRRRRPHFRRLTRRRNRRRLARRRANAIASQFIQQAWCVAVAPGHAIGYMQAARRLAYTACASRPAHGVHAAGTSGHASQAELNNSSPTRGALLLLQIKDPQSGQPIVGIDGGSYTRPIEYGLSRCAAWDVGLPPHCTAKKADGVTFDPAANPAWCSSCAICRPLNPLAHPHMLTSCPAPIRPHRIISSSPEGPSILVCPCRSWCFVDPQRCSVDLEPINAVRSVNDSIVDMCARAARPA